MDFTEWFYYVGSHAGFWDWFGLVNAPAKMVTSFATGSAQGLSQGFNPIESAFGFLMPTEKQVAVWKSSMPKVHKPTKVSQPSTNYMVDVRRNSLYWGYDLPNYDYMAYNMKSKEYYAYLEGLAAYGLSLEKAAEEEELSGLRSEYYRILSEQSQFRTMVSEQALKEETKRAEEAESVLGETSEALRKASPQPHQYPMMKVIQQYSESPSQLHLKYKGVGRVPIL